MLFDFNADGIIDILQATYDGEVLIYKDTVSANLLECTHAGTSLLHAHEKAAHHIASACSMMHMDVAGS